MRVFGLCIRLVLLLSVEPRIAAENASTDARRPEATAVADVSIAQRRLGPLAPNSRGATIAVPRAATRMIAPAPLAEPGDEMFIGTGDGSNGFWVRP